MAGYQQTVTGRHWDQPSEGHTIIPNSSNRGNSYNTPNSHNAPAITANFTSAEETKVEATRVEATQHKDGPWQAQVTQTRANSGPGM